MHVVFTDRALRDLDALRSYISEDNPTAAQAQVGAILSQVTLLASQPLLGHSGRIVGTRELVIARTRYIAAYLVDNDVVRILAVIHGSMIWPEEIEPS